ncbi:cyclodextrin-binding protein precursor [bacterium BMS3Abin02]|nr:cyclodextrin-binding protein precursor [bacterium BMS3Abin02]
MVGLLLAACTTEVAPSTTEGPRPTVTSPSVTTTVEPDRLEVWVDDLRAAVLAPFVADFAERAGVTVDVVSYPFDEIATSAATGDGPDIFVASHDRLASLLEQGAVVRVDLGVVGPDLDPVAVQAVTSGGETYAIPYGLEAVALYVNVDTVAGDVVPDTFASLRTLCASFETCVGIPEGLYHQYGFLSSSGGYVFRPSPGGGWSVNDVGLSKGVEGAKALGRLVADGTVFAGPYGDVVDGFVAGETPFLITGPWQVRPFGDAGVDFVVHPLPTLEGRSLRPFVGVQAFFVSAGAPPDLAESFVREVLARPEVLTAAALADDRVPAYLPARSKLDAHIAGFVESVDGGDLLPGVAEMVAVWDPLDAALDAIYSGLDPVGALTSAEEAVVRATAP